LTTFANKLYGGIPVAKSKGIKSWRKF